MLDLYCVIGKVANEIRLLVFAGRYIRRSILRRHIYLFIYAFIILGCANFTYFACFSLYFRYSRFK